MQSQSAEEYFASDQEANWETGYWTQMIYSILVLMVSIFSVSYIVRAVVEEKSSKLVETLLVSIRPLALILGKILAVMACVFGGFAAWPWGSFSPLQAPLCCGPSFPSPESPAFSRPFPWAGIRCRCWW